MTIAEIKNDPELFAKMDDDIEDFYTDDTEVVFDIYAFSYDSEWNLLGASLYLAYSPDPYETIEIAKKLSLADIQIDIPGTYVVLEVETIAGTTAEDFVNLGTIYTKNFF